MKKVLVVLLSVTVVAASLMTVAPWRAVWARSVQLVTMPTGDPIDLAAHNSAVTTIAFSPDGTWLATGSEDGSARLWPLHTATVVDDDFTRLAADTPDPTGHNVQEQCGDDFPAASAHLVVSQRDDSSNVTITVAHARPNTLYTTWLRLLGTMPGNADTTFGGSPITQAGSTPLAPTTALPELVAAGEGAGVADVANGFWTDEDGNGTLTVALDFPLIDGAYPFYKYDATLPPVATIGAPFAPFMIRLVSHCTDSLGHGVDAANREPWFDWSPQ
ncbi:MAG: WD40 repeat domain-containing protein [Caldilineaceae bacterium]